jgi:CBS domain containing-hemolysin-like protein
VITLLVYLAIALGFSFFCSIAEAVLLSVSTAYVRVLRQQRRPAADLLQHLKNDIDAPLAAILSLNTIAHTVGAAGVGAQAAQVFGSNSLGITSGVLTLLILVFSEIIPKTLGTYYWRQLAPFIAYALKYLVVLMAPLVWMSRQLTRKIAVHPTLKGFNRDEFAAMAQLGEQEGQLGEREAQVLENLFALRDTRVQEVMTPSTVLFRLPAQSTVELYFNRHGDQRFSRIPIYEDNPDELVGFVLRADLLLAKARGNADSSLSTYQRELTGVPDKLSLLAAFDFLLNTRAHMTYVVNEYGVLKGLVTLEDVFETLTGQEIVDEGDAAVDMQQLARSLWRKRARKMGIDLDEPDT